MSLSEVEVTLILLHLCPEGSQREFAGKSEPLPTHVTQLTWLQTVIITSCMD